MLFMGLLAVAGFPFSAKRGRWPKAGWGAESRYGPTKVRGDVRAIRLGSNQRATPHPALRATFPSKLGKGSARRSEMCEHCRGEGGGRSPPDEGTEPRRLYASRRL